MERLRQVLEYDASTGIFRWKVRLSPYAPAGSIAGTISNQGYRHIAIDRVVYLAPRLAWLYVRGEWPAGEVDHRDMNRRNDRFDNLRLASNQQNSANRRVLPSNKLGVKGVGISTWRKRKPQRYRARIRVNGVLIHLGYFSTPEDAGAAYQKAATQYFGEFARSA